MPHFSSRPSRSSDFVSVTRSLELVRHFAKGTPGPTVPTKAARGTVKSKVFAAVKEMREKGEIPPSIRKRPFAQLLAKKIGGSQGYIRKKLARLGLLADRILRPGTHWHPNWHPCWHPLALGATTKTCFPLHHRAQSGVRLVAGDQV